MDLWFAERDNIEKILFTEYEGNSIDAGKRTMTFWTHLFTVVIP